MRREQRSVLQTLVRAGLRLLLLALAAVTLSGESLAQDMPARWCPLESSRGQELQGAAPRPCVPFARVLEEANRKAREAERRDEEEMSAMRSLAGRALAGDNQQTQGRPRRESQPQAAVGTASERDSTDEDTDDERVAEPPSAVPVHVAVVPPKRPLHSDLKHRGAQKAALLPAGPKLRRGVETRRAAESPKAQLRPNNPVPPAPANPVVRRIWPPREGPARASMP